MYLKVSKREHAQLTWLLDCDVNVEEDFNAVCEESCPPVDDKHDSTAEYCAHQG